MHIRLPTMFIGSMSSHPAQPCMSIVKEDFDLDEDGKRFSWRYEYSPKTGLLTKAIQTTGTEWKRIEYYQYDSKGRLKHRFAYGFDVVNFPCIKELHRQKTGEEYTLGNEWFDYETCHCYLETRIIVGYGRMYYSEDLNKVEKLPYSLCVMSPYYIENNWYLKRPDYLTKMIENYEEELRKQEQNPLCPKAKLAHRVQLSPEIYPDMPPRPPRAFLKEVKEIYETMAGNAFHA